MLACGVCAEAVWHVNQGNEKCLQLPLLFGAFTFRVLGSIEDNAQNNRP